MDSVPGKVANKSQYQELMKMLHTLQTIPTTIPSQEWLVNYMIDYGFSKFLSEWISSTLKKSGEHMTFSFDVDGAIQMFESARDGDYWLLLEEPPKGMEIDIVRTESQLTWDLDVVERLESLTSRETDESRGKVSVHVVHDSGHLDLQGSTREVVGDYDTKDRLFKSTDNVKCKEFLGQDVKVSLKLIVC
ncbi:hypothetical protein LXL04_018373 [Taraxacum kok-saghyz]